MDLHFDPLTHLAALVVGTIAIIIWRFRETRSPVTGRSILLPPLGMSTGFSMFAVPVLRFPLAWGIIAFAAGALLFAVPLKRTSRLYRDGDVVLLQRSRAFLAILLLLAAVRFGLRHWLDRIITPEQTAALLFVLAFGMILRWRLGMWREYQGLVAASGRAERTAAGSS